LSLADHVPRALTTELVDASDVIVVMETAQALELAARYPQHRDRIVLLSLYDSAFSRGHGRYNIADPFGESLAAFGECYRRLDRAVTAFTDAIAATARAGRC
ncbi:MAG TPA: hypothetical protein VE379_07060, partial [Vicinamibacterales bacterium]|nr:hypothetical protein [Vicinamibacterales bacterium]